jgi:hypothetical protein
MWKDSSKPPKPRIAASSRSLSLCAKGERIAVTKRHPLRENMTTRKLFRGRHVLEIQINGRSYGKRGFELT